MFAGSRLFNSFRPSPLHQVHYQNAELPNFVNERNDIWNGSYTKYIYWTNIINKTSYTEHIYKSYTAWENPICTCYICYIVTYGTSLAAGRATYYFYAFVISLSLWIIEHFFTLMNNNIVTAQVVILDPQTTNSLSSPGLIKGPMVTEHFLWQLRSYGMLCPSALGKVVHYLFLGGT